MFSVAYVTDDVPNVFMFADAMITYPPHPRFPELEDAGWQSINDALRGERSPRSAVEEMQRTAERVVT